MNQKIFNVQIKKEVHNQKNGEIGIMTIIQIYQIQPDGKLTPFRSNCSYRIMNQSEASEYANKFLVEAISERRAS